MTSVTLVQILRLFDGILYATLFFVLILFGRIGGQFEVVNIEIILVIPTAILSFLIYHLPTQVTEIRNWSKIIFRLRLFSISLCCLFPFLFWCYSFPDSIYFLINSQFAILALIGLLFHLNAFVRELGNYSNNRFIMVGSQLNRFLLFYLLFIPFITLIVTYFIDSYASSTETYSDFFTLAVLFPPWLWFFFGIPIILCFLQFYTVQRVIVRLFVKTES